MELVQPRPRSRHQQIELAAEVGRRSSSRSRAAERRPWIEPSDRDAPPRISPRPAVGTNGRPSTFPPTPHGLGIRGSSTGCDQKLGRSANSVGLLGQALRRGFGGVVQYSTVHWANARPGAGNEVIGSRRPDPVPKVWYRERKCICFLGV
jgi:hypothetical protein